MPMQFGIVSPLRGLNRRRNMDRVRSERQLFAAERRDMNPSSEDANRFMYDRRSRAREWNYQNADSMLRREPVSRAHSGRPMRVDADVDNYVNHQIVNHVQGVDGVGEIYRLPKPPFNFMSMDPVPYFKHRRFRYKKTPSFYIRRPLKTFSKTYFGSLKYPEKKNLPVFLRRLRKFF